MLSDTDRAILWLLTAHRVATTRQIQQFVELPERTVRYRLHRLKQLRLVDAVRPYADRGSSPHHWFPTKVADAWATGAHVPRGGERASPNPAFVRHAAAVTALYVTLLRRGPALGFAVSGFARETEAREEFLDAGKATAIVPDLTVVLEWADAGYRAFVFGRHPRGFFSAPPPHLLLITVDQGRERGDWRPAAGTRLRSLPAALPCWPAWIRTRTN